MKIAVLLPGHIRAWEYCKKNFIETICHSDHKVDVFIDTYRDIFRNDYSLHKENEMKIIKNDDEILSMFDGINVVHFKAEYQIKEDPQHGQKRKTLQAVNAYEEYENKYGKYDLAIRTRFDLLLDDKLDYESIYENCIKNPKLIYIGNGAVHRSDNDMFAISNTDTFKMYGKRFLEQPQMTTHDTLPYLSNKYGIEYSQSIGISIVRLDGPGESIKYNNINYKIFK